MKIKSLIPSLLLSTVLVPSFGYGMDVEDDPRLSDAFREISSPVASSSSASSSKESRSQEDRKISLTHKLKKKVGDTGSAYEQVERFFAPLTRQEEAVELRKVVNVVCDFFEEKSTKALNMQMYLPCADKLVSDSTTTSSSSIIQKDRPQFDDYGRHIAMERAVKQHSKEIEALQAQHNAHPAQKSELAKKITDKEAALKTAQDRLVQIQEQEKASEKTVEAAQTLLATTKAELEPLAENLDSLEQRFEALKNEEGAGEKAQAARVLATLIQERPKRSALTSKIREAEEAHSTAHEAHLSQKFDTQKEATERAIGEIQAEIQKLNKDSVDQEKEYEVLPQKIATLKNTKQALQDKADTYALLKYFKLLNIYLALPNDDKSYYDKNEKLVTLSSGDLPLIRQLINLHKEQDFQTLKSKMETKTVAVLKRRLHVDLDGGRGEVFVAGKNGLNQAGCEKYSEEEHLNKRVQGVLLGIKKPLAESLVKDYESAMQDIPAFTPIDEASFHAQHAKQLDTLRADKLVKKAMDEWKRKISTGNESLVERLGLDSFLFNPDFKLSQSPDFFSFVRFKKEFSPMPEGQSSIQSTTFKKDLFSLGMTQIQTTHFVDSENDEVRHRTDPIYNFLRRKNEHKKAKTITSTTSSSMAVSDAEKATKAVLKYISYANMAMALRYDIVGTRVQPPKLVPLGFENLLKEPLTDADRLDNVLAAKAIKWGERLQNNKEFVKAHALNAHTFAPLTAVHHELRGFGVGGGSD